jgi:N-acetylglucosaminyldiphosphoundecaprenol N-acetyl-beta-D-mannosaminyltransferase
MAINVAKLVALQRDSDMREIVSRCGLITADGQPIVWASKLLGDPLPERVAGIDLMYGLIERAAAKGYRIYILGARHEVLERAVKRIHRLFPGAEITGYHHGYYSDEDEPAVAAQIGAARPDILFVAMSSPRKEYFIGRHREVMNVPFVMGVGGSIDVMAGLTTRAPVFLRRLGLEWLYRLVQEPRRLFWRYVSTNARFLLLLSREVMRARLGPRRPS